MFTPEYLNELVESSHAAASEFNMYLTNKVIDSIVNLFESEGEIKIISSNVQRLKLLNEQSGILASDIEKEIRKRICPVLEKCGKRSEEYKKLLNRFLRNYPDIFLDDTPF